MVGGCDRLGRVGPHELVGWNRKEESGGGSDERLNKMELRVQTKTVEEPKTFLDNLLLFICDALTQSLGEELPTDIGDQLL